MLIKNLGIIAAADFELIEDGFIEIGNSVISAVGSENAAPTRDCYDGRGLLAIPGLINAHVHLGDSVAKDLGFGRSLNELVHPIFGLKAKILQETPRKNLVSVIRETLDDMVRCGTTSLADFREDGLDGARLLSEAIRDLDIKPVILSQPKHCFNPQEVQEDSKGLPKEALEELGNLLEECDGLGLSGPNEFTDLSLRQVASLAHARNKLIAIHAAESRETREFSLRSFNRTEVARAVEWLRPHFLVHLTSATPEDLKLIARLNIPVVCCPRANGQLGAGFPLIAEMLRLGIIVALGTDNVMLNSPDLFREMDYTLRMSQALEEEPGIISPREILKMVTVNAATVLRIEDKLGTIAEGKQADLVFVDTRMQNLKPMKDPFASLVHRVRPDNIRAVMIKGEFVYGGLHRLA